MWPVAVRPERPGPAAAPCPDRLEDAGAGIAGPPFVSACVQAAVFARSAGCTAPVVTRGAGATGRATPH